MEAPNFEALTNEQIRNLCTNCGEKGCPRKIKDGQFPHCYRGMAGYEKTNELIFAAGDALPADTSDETLDKFDSFIKTLTANLHGN